VPAAGVLLVPAAAVLAVTELLVPAILAVARQHAPGVVATAAGPKHACYGQQEIDSP
jgi:hypothetical protein